MRVLDSHSPSAVAAPIEVPPVPEIASPGHLSQHYAQDDHRDRFDRENALLKLYGLRPDMVFLGDSLTQDWPVASMFSDLFPVVVNRGVGGDTAKNLHLRVEADVLQLQPKNVHLMIGTNDIAIRFGYDSNETIVENYVRDFSGILQQFQDAGIHCYLGTVTPQRQTLQHDREYERKAEIVPLFNNFLREKAAAMKMTLVDYNPHFYNPDLSFRDELFTDGVHHTALGQYVLTQVLRNSVRSRIS